MTVRLPASCEGGPPGTGGQYGDGQHGRDDWGRTDEFRCAEVSDSREVAAGS
jgi:hypothetical protein